MTLDQIVEKWPRVAFEEEDQPHFLFIVTPPYSGSTALAALLNTSHRTMMLQERGEGQWLVPGLCEKDRWSQDKEIDYQSVKAVWLNKYQQMKRTNQNIDVVIEKSPPNLIRIEMLSRQFREFSFLANNRDPYANCASILYRNYDADNMSVAERTAALSTLARDWIMRSLILKHLISDLQMPLLTYEDFCRNPALVLNMLRIPARALETINPRAYVKVKDYKSQPISNQNARQISKLTLEELEYISYELKPHRELLSFFGYQCRNLSI